MKLQLPSVTLLAVDTVCHELSRMTLEDCLAKCEFGDVVIFSDREILPGARHVQIEPLNNRGGLFALGQTVWEHLKTGHSLQVHWDAGMLDTSAWKPEFLNYDYIGAPWWYDENNVGCAGFTLRSRALFARLALRPDLAPTGPLTDEEICRTNRKAIEAEGFTFAPEDLALDFAFERVRKTADSKHFGYHGAFNWPMVYEGDELARRMALLAKSDYARNRGMLHELYLISSVLADPKRTEPCFPWKLPQWGKHKLPAKKSAETHELAFDSVEMLIRAGKRDQASRICWEIVRKNPNHFGAWATRARLEAEAGRSENAVLHYGMALQIEPDNHAVWCNYAIDAMGARMYKESENGFRKSIALHPTFNAHYSYGNLLSALVRVDEAVEQFERALKLDEKDPQIHANLGIATIAQGKWKDGFTRYTRRFDAPGFPPRPRFNYPRWTGQPLAGKTIMLYAEQGFGDEIMSLRFVKPVKDLGATVILAVRPPVFRLAQTLAGVDHLVIMYGQLPVTPDYMCPLLDVPAYVDITPETVPLKQGYLSADDRGHRIGMKPGFNVGICWASGKRDLQPSVAETARQKSLTFESFKPLARPGVNLVCLQQNHVDGSALRDLGVVDAMVGVHDFADTAFWMDHLDLIITVDTSVAHLAGAMGRPVWNLVRFDALWPWMQETDGTCWYDSMKIYRQTQPYDWTAPMRRLMADFDEFVSNRCVAAAE